MKMRGWTICPLCAMELLIDHADSGIASPEIEYQKIKTALLGQLGTKFSR
jgi:hypothetical protein